MSDRRDASEIVDAGSYSGGSPLASTPLLVGLWRAKWLVLAIVTTSTSLSVAYALFAKQWYHAEVLLKPADSKSTQGGLGAQLGGLGELANLAGVTIGGGGTAEPVAVLKSREFTGDFIMENNLLPVLFAQEWDEKAGTWKSSDKRKWRDVRDGVRYFDKDIRTVVEDKRTGLVTLSVEWPDARLASEWANQLADRLNDRMRQRALIESEANVSYLRHELAGTDVFTLQQSIGRLLDSELQKLMLAKGKKEFAFRIIDHAEVSKYPARPKRAQVVIFGFVLGVVLSTLILSIRRSSGPGGADPPRSS